MHMNTNPLSLALRSALLTSPLLLAACGGGGSSTKSDAPAPPVIVEPITPPPIAPVIPPAPAPETPPAPTPIAPAMDPNAVLPSVYNPIAYTVPNAGHPDVSPYAIAYNHLERTRVMEARAKGLTGAGVNVGVVDTNINVFHPTLQGPIAAVNNVVSGNTAKSLTGPRKHATYTSQMIAGQGLGDFQGGVAPNAHLYVAAAESVTATGEYTFTNDDLNKATEWLMGVNSPIINYSLNNTGHANSVIGNEKYFARGLASYAVVAQKAVDQGILVVFSTGNDSMAHPGDFALLPLAHKNLEKGWLAVASIEKDSLALSDFSNACGDAMNWCLVAPGNVYVKNADLNISKDTDFNRDRNIAGTSFSAPTVSGVAALVKEAFPWMTNNQLRHTLLGTATDLGAPGVDAVFGYGLVNADKATNGLAWLNWGQEDLNVTGSSVFSNALFGEGGIDKRGTGHLLLSGTNTYTGVTVVKDGVLDVSGSLSSATTVEKNGHLILSGRIHNTVANAGVLTSVGGSMAGFTQDKDGVFQAVLGAPTAIDGTAVLDGTLRIVGRASNDYVVKSNETIATAGLFTGAFDSMTVASSVLLEGTLEATDTRIGVNISRVDPTTLAVFKASPLAQEMGAQLKNAFTVADSLAGQATTAEEADFLGGMGKVQNFQDTASLYDWTQASSRQPTIASFNTLALIRHADTSLAWDRLKSVSSDTSGAYATFGSDDWKHRPDGWLTTQLTGSNTVAGADWTNGSTVLGINGRHSDGKLTAGAARSTVRSDTLAVYAAQRIDDWTAAVQLSRGEGKWHAPGQASDRIEQRSVSAHLDRRIEHRWGRFTPALNYTASRHTFDPRNPAGVSGFEMGFLAPTLKLNSWLVDVGFESHAYDTVSGWSWNWTAALGWEDIHQQGGEWSAYYQIDPSQVFTQNYARLNDQQWKGSVGVAARKNGYSLFGRWDGRSGSTLSSNGFQIGARVDF